MKQALEQLRQDPHYACMMEEVAMVDNQASSFNGIRSEAAVRPTGLAVQTNPQSALQPAYYCWENGRLQEQKDRWRQEALRYSFIDPYASREYYRLIKFFIRHPLDPTGSCSPSLKIYADTTLGEIFDWYLLETYEGPRHVVLPDGDPQMRKDYCLMKIDLINRTLGKKYYYQDVKFSGLRVQDTEWWDDGADDLRRVTVASSDRVMGNYKPQLVFRPCH